MTQMPPGAMRLSSVIGVDVVGSDITRLGEVEDVLVGPDGRIQAVVIEVGGFLGLGEKSVAVPYADLLFNFNVDPTTGPSASTTGGQPLEDGAFQVRSAESTAPGPAVPEATGTVGDPAQPQEGLQPKGATVRVTGDGDLRHVVLRMTKEELEKLPEARGAR
jgi:sporulation protein YlmC with PRC-barrel domain